MSRTRHTATFTMSNGKKLSCVYYVDHFPGSYDEPPDSSASEPELEIDGDPVEWCNLPKGLSVVAEDMYDNPCPKYGKVTVDDASYDDFDDYEPLDVEF